ncbi:DUF4340 domain-containing protein [SAR202 cluster bacterium AC-647-N09_OGT_505m]|nr:DUF4340 domain-containing protein [SAR202 cluster bacterium AC-647-N09_OGT_505m]
MSIRTSIILVVTLVMVAGYVFFIQIERPTEDQDTAPWFYNVDMSDMTQISITDREEEAVFFLGEDNHWHIDDPEGLPVGQDLWGGVNLILSGPKSRRLLDVQPTDLEPYGLESPLVKIDVKLRDGRTLPVRLGFLTPNQVNVYAKIEGFPQIFTLYSGWGDVLTRLITQPPYPSWYYNVDPLSVTRIRLRTQEHSVGLSRADIGWSFDDEAQSPVSEAQLSTIFVSLEQPSEQALVEYEVLDVARYGLDEPALTLLLQTRGIGDGGAPTAAQIQFHIGNPTEDGTGYYAQTEKGELFRDVFKVNADWVEGLQTIVADPQYLGDAAQGS